MNKLQERENDMDKKTGVIIGVIILAFLGLVGVTIAQNNSKKTKINYDEYDVAEIITAEEGEDDPTGGFGDLIEGDPDAPVVIYEYGDYQCTACAPMNPYINEVIEEYDGKVAVVFRTYIMSYHQNGTAAASAALAAAKQGYWQEYKDILFTNQNDWYYSDADQRQQQFEEYFQKVSENKGDLERFREDMASDEVSRKISFDTGLSEKVQVDWTPTFYLGDELIDQREISTSEFLKLLREKIDAELKAKNIEKPQKAIKAQSKNGEKNSSD